jgi:hypothetical protein
MTDQLFDEGQTFRNFLAEAFKEGKEVLLSGLTNDGSVYCVLSLIASQQVLLRNFC